MRVVVVGGSGFVGGAAVRALRDSGAEVAGAPAPRLAWHQNTNPRVILARAREMATGQTDLRSALQGAEVVINAAGIAAPSAEWSPGLVGANAVLPVILQELSRELNVYRYIHVSSAAVQGRLHRLDQSMHVAPFSPYSESKALGEKALLLGRWERSVIYRPTSVHGATRAVTRTLVKLARSPYACVAGTGDRPTPQVLDANVGAALAFLALTDLVPPEIVLQPWEGHSTGGLLTLLGGKPPHLVPDIIARSLLATGYATSRLVGRWEGHARRLEMLLMGQDQARSWLDESSWRAPHGSKSWVDLGRMSSETTQDSYS